MFCCYKYVCLSLYAILFTSKACALMFEEVLEDHLKDISRNEEAELFKQDKQRAENNHQIERQASDSHRNQFSKVSDDSKHLKKEHDSKLSSENDAYAGYNTKQDKIEDSQTNGLRKAHKKGHHKQGFQNSYHKDESSNKSTYFDDYNDEGDQSAFIKKANNYDNQGSRKYQAAYENGQEYVQNNYNDKAYNRYGDAGNKRVDHQDYSKKYYLDDTINHNRYRNNQGIYNKYNVRGSRGYIVNPDSYDPGWDWQRSESQNHWERPEWDRRGLRGIDYSGPGYYEGGLRRDGRYEYGPNHRYGYAEFPSRPIVEIPKYPQVGQRKKTITIFEDPRYDGDSNGHFRREEADILHLDFQPSRHRYTNYDDSYYNIPNRQGVTEASAINRLIYNYRHH